MKHTALFAISLALSACSAIGPTSSPKFPALIRAAVPPQEGEIHIVGSASWYPNTRGFTPLRSTLLGRPSDPIPGALAITTSSLVFSQWDEVAEKFEPIKRIRYIEIEDVSLDSFGVNRRMVIRKTDLSVDSFDFTRAAGNLVDAEKVEEAVKFVQSKKKDG